jgi:hypothetical protein
MKLKYLGYKHLIHLMYFSVLCLLIYSSSIGVAVGQKIPTTLKLDADTDDRQICSGQGKGYLNGSQFCVLFRSYYSHLNSGNLDGAQADRNEMIEIVRGQIDIFYKHRKDGRRFKTKVYQQILDFLEIGGALSIAIMNGERAKTIVGAAIGALQGGRTSYNKNFDLLETHVLINKMNTNRALILTEILGNIDKPVRSNTPSNAYSWYAAKNDLRRYLFAGTYDNALDTLVRQTGADVENAERELRRVEKRRIINEATPSSVVTSEEADARLVDIEQKLKGSDKDKESATNALRNILAELNNTPVFKAFLRGKGITAKSSGEAIVKAIDELRSENADDDDLSQKIEQVIVAKGEIK